MHVHELMYDLESILKSRSADPSFCNYSENLLLFAYLFTNKNVYVTERHSVRLFVLVAPVISAQMAPLRDQHLKAADFNHLCYIHSI